MLVAGELDQCQPALRRRTLPGRVRYHQQNVDTERQIRCRRTLIPSCEGQSMMLRRQADDPVIDGTANHAYPRDLIEQVTIWIRPDRSCESAADR